LGLPQPALAVLSLEISYDDSPFLIAVLAAVTACVAPVLPDAAPEIKPSICYSPAVVVRGVLDRYPSAEVIADLTGDRAAVVLRILRASPPIIADRVIVLSRPGVTASAVKVFSNGCLLGDAVVPNAVLLPLIGEAA